MVLSFGEIVEFDSPLNLLNREESIFSSLVNENGEEFRNKMLYLA